MHKLDGQGRPFITLAQFLKQQHLVDSGADAKQRVRDGGVHVNGEEDVRPGRKLHTGDTVALSGRELTVGPLPGPDGPA